MGNRKSTIFNSSFHLLGYEPRPDGQTNADFQKAIIREREIVIAEFCEEMLLFDKVSLKADRINHALRFLISEFGIDTIQEFIERGLIEILMYTPLIVTSTGRALEDGTIDKNAVLGTPPLASGKYSDEDTDIDNNIKNALSPLNINRDRIRSFSRAIEKSVIFPNNALAKQSVDLIINAYTSGKLSTLGLVNEKPPEDLDVEERLKLLELSSEILETAIVAQYEYKSSNRYSYSEISKASLEAIGSALEVKENSQLVLNFDNVPDLKTMFLTKQLLKDDLKKLRYKPVSKTFRKWLNEVSQNEDCLSVTEEYINEVTGKNKFFESTGGKFLKNIGMLGVGAGLGVAIGGLAIPSATIGAIVAKGSELGLGLFDSFYLDGLLKGRNPRMFVDEIKKIKKVGE